MKKLLFTGVLFLTIGIVLLWQATKDKQPKEILLADAPTVTSGVKSQEQATPLPTPTPTPSPTPVPLPDPKVYGPCRNIPVVLYHHVGPKEDVEAKGQKNISVYSDVFAEQMAYLAERGYNTLTPSEFISSVANGTPARSVLLTFDDGYDDLFTWAYPELVKNNLKATLFVSTGLIGNPGYLNWEQLDQMKGSGLITFANHTWSHKNLGAADEGTISYEVQTAKTQLLERGIFTWDIFAYPYGSTNSKVERVLQDHGIVAAFTTVPGSYQCAKLPLAFRRMRIGNSSLGVYGF